MADFKVVIIGAGVVGLAIAERLSRKYTGIALLERNPKYGMEISSRNSEVIHAGIYYAPGSLKAKLCVEGREMLYNLCETHGISHRRITKIITATSPEEVPKLEKIYENGIANGAPLEMLDRKKTLAMERNIQTFGAIYSPTTGMISAHELMDYFYHESVKNGVIVQHQCKVVGMEPNGEATKLDLEEHGERTSLTADIIVNAAGLGADEIAEMAGIDIDAAGYRVVYCKGSYFSLPPSRWKIITRLVYPVPPIESLGVHALIDVGGRLKFGPDVEYLKDRTTDYRVDEGKRKEFAAAIRRILPSITDEEVIPDMCGIRPKLQRAGQPATDFIIVNEKKRGLRGFINLIGIDSPGLTASPAIARYVEELID
jgi:L-2-hydroxyglutarate oxidase LhgO